MFRVSTNPVDTPWTPRDSVDTPLDGILSHNPEGPCTLAASCYWIERRSDGARSGDRVRGLTGAPFRAVEAR
jgi:hypothetical protein